MAAVNYHFGDKQQLYEAAVRQAQCARMHEVPMPEWGPDVSAEQRLREFIQTLLTRMLGHRDPGWHRELMLREIAHPSAACVEFVEAYIRPMARRLHDVLAELLPPGLPEQQRQLLAFSIVGQCFFHYVNRPIITLLIGEKAAEGLTIERLAGHITQFSLAAIRGFAAGPPEGGLA